MRKKRRPFLRGLSSLTIFLLILAFLSATTLFASDAMQTGGGDGSQQNELNNEIAPLVNAYDLVISLGEYDFTADVEQTFIPRAIPQNVGQSETRHDSRIKGNVVFPDFMALDLQFEAAANIPPIKIEQEGINTYLIEGEERVPIQNPIGSSMPDGAGEFLGLIYGAENVVLVENPDWPEMTIYQFDINGDQYAEYVAGTIQANMQEENPGVIIEPSAYLQSMNGSGEIWLDEEGLPVRQIMTSFVPEMSEGFDSSTKTIITYRYDQQIVDQVIHGIEPLGNAAASSAGDEPWTGMFTAEERQSYLDTGAQFSTAERLLLGSILGLVVVVCLFIARETILEKRWVNYFLPFLIAATVLFGPLLQPVAAVYHTNNQPQEQTLFEALGVETEAESEGEDPSLAEPYEPQIISEAVTAQTTNEDNDNVTQCGDGNTVDDSDNDGLTDFVEICLGTSRYSIDSDDDIISDTLEVEGFLLAGERWYSNPLYADSNFDGLTDYEEYPAPIGLAPSHDPDGDNIPNIWDLDNDGDGVADEIDIDPFTATGFQTTFSFESTLDEDDFDGYQYIEFQVRPQDVDHLRYTTSILDWPNNDKTGNIMDHDSSQRDIELLPALKIRTKTPPNQFIRADYGLPAFNLQGRGEWSARPGDEYDMYVYLSPVSHNGQIVAYQGEIVYAPEDIANIDMTSIEFAWTAMANADRVDEDGTVITEPLLLTEYVGENYQITGVSVLKSGEGRFATFGTPNKPYDNRDLFQVMLGMEATFLSYQNPDLNTLISRFNSPTTSITETWGIPSTDVTVVSSSGTSTHSDELTFALGEGVRTLLTNNYPQSGDQMVSVAVAAEYEIGTATMEDVYTSGTEIKFNLANIPQAKMRNLSLMNFDYNAGDSTWNLLDRNEIIDYLALRYADQSAAINNLKAEYPDVSEGELFLLVAIATLSLTYDYPFLMTELDGVQLVGDSVDDAQVLGELELDGGPTDLPSYLAESQKLLISGSALIWEEEYQSEYKTASKVKYGFSLAKKIYDFYSYANSSKGLFTVTNTVANKIKSTKDWGNTFVKTKWLGGGKSTTSGTKFGKWLIKNSKLFGKIWRVAASVVAVVLLAIELYFIWKHRNDFSSPYDYEEDFATAYAVTASIVATLLTILALTGIGAVLVIAFALAAAIVYLISWAVEGEGYDLNAEFVKGITELFFEVDAWTKLLDLGFKGVEVKVEGSLTPGGKLIIQDEFFGAITRVMGSDDTQLELSGSLGTFAYSVDEDKLDTDKVAVSTYFELLPNYNRWCPIGGYGLYDPDENVTYGYANTQVCRNDLFIEYTFYEPGINVPLNLIYEVEAETRYQEYKAFRKGNDTQTFTEKILLPEELKAEDQWSYEVFYVDIVPDTLDGLWSWNEITNRDPDGDGLTASEETANGTNPTLYDTDGDGLSDEFEANQKSELGTDPTLFDSDNDGLSDGIEYAIGTNPGLADTDNDNLDDGEEYVTYNSSTGTWSGGGWFVDINGTQYWTFSSPFQDDADKDSLLDGSEKAGLTTPQGYNDVPQLALDGSTSFSPSGANAIYVRQGDTFTASLSINNIGTGPINQAMDFCLPSTSTPVAITTTGYVTPTTSLVDTCYVVDFATTPLPFFGTMTIDVEGTAGSSTTLGEISVTQPYTASDGSSQPISLTVPYNEDNTPPTVKITSPEAGDKLAGDFYIMGGYADDPDTWVELVEVTVPIGDGTSTETGPATGTDDWAYSWELPDDGSQTPTVIAVDGVGNVSLVDSTTVIVDSLGPDFTINIADGQTIASSNPVSFIIPLAGTVTDNFSGVTHVLLQVNDRPWRLIWQDDTPSLSSNWSGEWVLPNLANAQGDHTIRLLAYDEYDNTTLLERTVTVDVVEPTSELTNRNFTGENPPHVALNQTLDLFGVANDTGNNPIAPGPQQIEGNVNVLEDSTVWLQIDEVGYADSGITLNWIGDFNGDRFGDLAVGLPAAGDDTGLVVVVPGRAGDWPIPALDEVELLASTRRSYAGTTNAQLGQAIQPGGDFNGDGIDELLIGDITNNRIHMLLGNAFSTAFYEAMNGEENGNRSLIYAELDGESLTNNFASVGDVNDDGQDDLLVSVVTASTGYVYMIVGDETHATSQPVNNFAAAIFETSSAGAAVGGVGDVTGDFIDDFAIASGGTVYLFEGGGGWIQQGQTILTASDAIATFPTADALPTIIGNGDINGDGQGDFVYSNGTTPTVVLGSAALSFGSLSLSGYPSALTGAVYNVGDVNKDNLSDLLVINVDGDAYLLHGDNLSTPAATIAGVVSAAQAPYTGGSDLIGDGSADLVLVPDPTLAASFGFDTFSQASASFISVDALPTGSNVSSLASSDSANTGQTAGISDVSTSSLVPILPGDVTVGPGDDTDYYSIQAAIDEPTTQRVLVEPGVYAEAITLRDGVEVIGSGADKTIIAFSGGVTETILVDMRGASNASLVNVSLVGDGIGTGVRISDTTSNLYLARTIIRDMGTAVSLIGSGSDLEAKSLTIVGNTNGVDATNGASIDFRNTIFAYNTGTALNYDPGAAVTRHEFNLFWANGTDQTPIDPGSGELFSDPLFVDFGNNDYRVEDLSPVIDAGSPGDAIPSGAGARIDIGHTEQTGTSFFVDDDYCGACENDGLAWGVDAFSSITEGVQAAIASRTAIKSDTPVLFSVGVGPGTYTGTVEISGSLQLIGSGAGNTTIIGDSEAAVVVNGGINTTISGFELVGNSYGIHILNGSSAIDVNHNLIRTDNTGVGIKLEGRSSGFGGFNTIVENLIGIEAFAQYNWFDIKNSIMISNATGMMAHGPSIPGSTGTAVIFSSYNMLNNTTNYSNVVSTDTDIVGVDPLLDSNFQLTADSPAVDAAQPEVVPPVGGGIRADIGFDELLGAPISVMMGQADDSVGTGSVGVGGVEFAIVPVTTITSPVTSTLPGPTDWTSATLTSPGEKFTYWSGSYVPTTEGYYRIYSRAIDSLGNAELDETTWFEGAFIAEGTAPVVTLTVESFPTTGARLAWRLLKGQVFDYGTDNSFDIDEIYFEIEGTRYDAKWAVEQWEADGVTPRTFYLLYRNELPAGELDFQAFAIDGAGFIGQSAVVTDIVDTRTPAFRDTLPPQVDPPFATWGRAGTEPPPFNTIVTGTVKFLGFGTDRGGPGLEVNSDIQMFEMSFDGGQTWEVVDEFSAATFGHDYEHFWDAPPERDATTIPALVRATDWADISGVNMISVTFDTLINANFTPVTYSQPFGSHLDQGEPEATLQIEWTQPTDASGVANSLFGISSITSEPVADIETSETITTVVVEYQAGFNGGNFLALGAIDEANNRNFVTGIGPWYGSNMRSAESWNFTLQSHFGQGIIDIGGSEWLTETELLDVDIRPDTDQTFYATWDSVRSWVGWQGATWDTDGEMWVYYDIKSGEGTTTTVNNDGVVLPFEADFAAYVPGSVVNEGGPEAILQYFFYYAGGQWRQGANFEASFSALGHDVPTAGTEIRHGLEALDGGSIVYTDQYDHHRMVAYAQDDSGEMWSSFPTSNDLSGVLTNYYEWEIVTDGFDLLNLPNGARNPFVTLDVTTNPSLQETVTNNGVIQYVITLENIKDEQATNLNLSLETSTGLTLDTSNIIGATCTDCSDSSNITLSVADLDVGASQLVTVSGQLASDLTGIPEARLDVQLETDVAQAQAERLIHTVDIDGPTVDIVLAPGNVINTGAQQVDGTADDGNGTGVALVEYRVDGGAFVPADGTIGWTIDLTLPATGSVQLDVRATDYHGIVGPVNSVTLNVDTVGPIFKSFAIPTTVEPAERVFISGIIDDVSPDPFGAVETVEVQVDSENDLWEEFDLIFLTSFFSDQLWSFTWTAPNRNGVSTRFRFRATDYVGNQTISDWYTIVTDDGSPNQAPTVDAGDDVTITLPSGVNLVGTVNDDGLPAIPGTTTTLWTKVSGPGDVTFFDAAATSTTASFSLPGTYVLRLTADDSELTASDDVTVVVEGQPVVNVPPVAVDDSATTNENVAVLIDVLANDSDADDDSLSIQSFTQPTNGAVIQSGSQLEYTPLTNFNGVETFTYVISDGVDVSDSATVTVTVQAVNFLPVITTISSLDLSEGDVFDINLDDIVSDVETADENIQWAVSSSDPTVADVALLTGRVAQISGVDGDGVATITLTATDRGDPDGCSGPSCAAPESASADIEVTVLQGVVNLAPTVDAGDDVTITLPSGVNLVGTVNDDGLPNPPAATTVLWTQISGPGTVTFADDTATSTSATFSVDGTYILRLMADDGELTSSSDVTVIVQPEPFVNIPPVAVADEINTSENSSVTIDVLTNDTDADDDTLVIESFTQPTSGVVTQNGSQLEYTPATNFNGFVTFTYVISDGVDVSNSATVSATVDPVNSAPVVNTITELTLDEGESFEIDLDTIVSDVETAAGDIQWSASSSDAAVADVAISTAEIATISGIAGDGTAIISLTATDGGDPDGCAADPCDDAESTTVTIVVTVNEVTTQPVGTVEVEVWDDLNGNGIKQGSEPLLDGITINLLTSANILVDSTVSVNGLATFEAPAGNYKIEAVLPANHAFTLQNAGTNENADSDVRRSNGRSGTFPVVVGETETSVDVGLWTPGTVEVEIWDDLNGNGIKASSDPLVSEPITVNLLDGGNNLLQSTTSVAGLATFTDVPADMNVKIEVVLPSGYAFTLRDIGTNESRDSDVSRSNGRSSTFKLESGSETVTTVDAGVWSPATVIVQIFDDLNGNGRNQSADPLVDVPITVNLLDGGNNLLQSTTSVAGIATFTGVPADMNVKIEAILPDGYAFTLRDVGSNESNDSDVSRSNGRSGTFKSEEGGETITNVDVGVWSPGEVEVFVWQDLNGNGRQGRSEPGLAGVTVQLVFADGSSVIDPATGLAVEGVSDAFGLVTLGYLPADVNVRLKVIEPAGFDFARQNIGNDSRDSDVSPSTGLSGTFKSDEGQATINSWDVGFIPE